MIYKDSMEIRGRYWEFIGINENPNQIKDSRGVNGNQSESMGINKRQWE